ncbi:hypothetical protein [Streptomyces sp. CA-179760]|uniref:hypothetical protein n=1 Tax=Streptomyces sp. CA-179760 TaxID=3240054 RepID=UPI003D8B0B53
MGARGAGQQHAEPPDAPADASGPEAPASPRSDIRIYGDQYGQAGGTHYGDQRFDFTRPARDERR